MRLFVLIALIIFLATEPTFAAPYALRPLDSLKITVVKHPELATDQTVTPNGEVSLPFLGITTVSGWTLQELEDTYKKTLSRYLENPQLVILLTPASPPKEKKVNWWDQNWYRVISACAVVTGIYWAWRR